MSFIVMNQDVLGYGCPLVAQYNHRKFNAKKNVQQCEWNENTMSIQDFDTASS